MAEPEIPHIIAGPAAIVSRRYAAALYEMAESAGQLDAVTADMRTLKELLKGNNEFRQMSKNPRLTRAQLVDMVGKVSAIAEISKMAASFLNLLAHNRRLKFLGHIIAVFLFEVHKHHGEKTALVTAARTMSQQQQDALAATLSKITGSKVNVVVKEDASLIGGLMVKVGSKLIDASLKGKLARIERQLKSQNSAVTA